MPSEPRPNSSLLTGLWWQSNSPFPRLEDWVNDRWLGGDTHPLGVVWGI